jgi:hypothetical protein
VRLVRVGTAIMGSSWLSPKGALGLPFSTGMAFFMVIFVFSKSG